MLGSGIFFTPGELAAVARAPWHVYLLWALAGGITLCGALTLRRARQPLAARRCSVPHHSRKLRTVPGIRDHLDAGLGGRPGLNRRRGGRVRRVRRAYRPSVRSLVGARLGRCRDRVFCGGRPGRRAMGRTHANCLDDGEGCRTAGARGRQLVAHRRRKSEAVERFGRCRARTRARRFHPRSRAGDRGRALHVQQGRSTSPTSRARSRIPDVSSHADSATASPASRCCT